MKIGRSAFLLLVPLAFCGLATAQPKHPHSSEQTHFSAEDAGVQKPVPIPADVLAILGRDDLVRNVLEDQELPGEKLPQSWFSASEIHLSSSSETDLVVVAEGPLAGGNVDVFWVFCATRQGHELVLMAPEHDLVVKRARWMGHREIELMSATAVQWSGVLLRWDGRKYAAYRTKSVPIK